MAVASPPRCPWTLVVLVLLLASTQYKVDLSIDAAWGRDGHAVYFYIGQAF